MAGFRVPGQQTEALSDFVQYISGEAAAALAYKITLYFVENFLRFGRERPARHLAPMFRSTQRCKHFGHDGFAVEAFALAKRLEPLDNFGMDLILAETSAAQTDID
jgi:hypothetical protein